jgi:hypothetical protein
VVTAHSAVATVPAKSAAVGGLWVRPPAKVAARNVRRCGYGKTLAPLGARNSIIERLTEGDMQAVVSELKQQAKAGDASASNQLLYMSRLTCGFAAINGAGSASEASQLLDSQALPTTDGDWVRAAIQEKNEFNQRITAICQQSLDRDEINAWVTASAAQGDPASHYLLSIIGNNRNAGYRDAQLRDAVAGSYSWAQFLLAQGIIAEIPVGSQKAGATDNAGDLLRTAAVDIPVAESALAKCEFNGCTDIPQDLPSSVADAREAAQRGNFDAILEIGPQLQASQIDPDEVAAWNLISASLQMQGYAGRALDVGLLKSASGILSSHSIPAKARQLADQYWQQYGPQMLANLGCGP